MRSDHTDAPAGCETTTVYIAFELSKSKWQLGVMMPGAEKMSRYQIDGGDLMALSSVLAKVRAKAEQLGKPVRILSCYEAGLDGHWLHRWLSNNGIVNYEIDASSIEVNRRARRAKTDRIDLAQLMRALLAYLRGEPGVCSMVRVPTPEDEDRKRRTRERERLLKERTAHTNRIKGLLHGQGIRDAICRRVCATRSAASMSGCCWCTSRSRRSKRRTPPRIVRRRKARWRRRWFSLPSSRRSGRSSPRF